MRQKVFSLLLLVLPIKDQGPFLVVQADVGMKLPLDALLSVTFMTWISCKIMTSASVTVNKKKHEKIHVCRVLDLNSFF